MDYIEISAKTVEEAVAQALAQLSVTSDKLEYEVVDEGSAGFLGMFGSKPAVIRARKKFDLIEYTQDFVDRLFQAMDVEVSSDISYDEEEKTMNIVFTGGGMGLLIGKRGQTLDSLQYIISLVVNKESDSYIRVKADTENYRERRRATLENLAKNIAYKVKRTRRQVVLEPMNPYERRIIHSALQGDKYVETHSEGEEPYRKVVVTLKKEYRDSLPARSGHRDRDRKRGGYGSRRRDHRPSYNRSRYGDYNRYRDSEDAAEGASDPEQMNREAYTAQEPAETPYDNDAQD